MAGIGYLFKVFGTGNSPGFHRIAIGLVSIHPGYFLLNLHELLNLDHVSLYACRLYGCDGQAYVNT